MIHIGVFASADQQQIHGIGLLCKYGDINRQRRTEIIVDVIGIEEEPLVIFFSERFCCKRSFQLLLGTRRIEQWNHAVDIV